jgi:hypothetical protein
MSLKGPPPAFPGPGRLALLLSLGAHAALVAAGLASAGLEASGPRSPGPVSIRLEPEFRMEHAPAWEPPPEAVVLHAEAPEPAWEVPQVEAEALEARSQDLPEHPARVAELPPVLEDPGFFRRVLPAWRTRPPPMAGDSPVEAATPAPAPTAAPAQAAAPRALPSALVLPRIHELDARRFHSRLREHFSYHRQGSPVAALVSLDAQGRVEAASLLPGPGPVSGPFADGLLAILRSTRFEPALSDGVPVAATVGLELSMAGASARLDPVRR